MSWFWKKLFIIMYLINEVFIFDHFKSQIIVRIINIKYSIFLQISVQYLLYIYKYLIFEIRLIMIINIVPELIGI